MTGLIAFVQIVHYPLFGAVDAASFSAYHREHLRRTTLVVAPLMLVEAATALAIAVLGLASRLTSATALALLGVVWGATMLLSVPRHNDLARQFTVSTHAALVATNWIRTIAWGARAALSLAMLSAFYRIN